MGVALMRTIDLNRDKTHNNENGGSGDTNIVVGGIEHRSADSLLAKLTDITAYTSRELISDTCRDSLLFSP